jgi:ABC-type branched-subunit amino acid transport system substrate-binding protein
MDMLRRRLAAAGFIAGSLGPSISSHASAQEVVFGQSAPLSGPFASLGEAYRNGALLAFDEANKAGELGTRRVRLVTLDDAYNVDKAVANARALIEEHRVSCFFNHMFTNTVRATLPLAVAAGIPFVGAYSGHPDLYRNDQPLLFMTRASFAQELQRILDYLVSVGYKRTALVYYDNAVGEELRQDVQAGLIKRGRPLFGTAKMPVGGAAALAAKGTADNDIDAVVLGVSGSDAVAYIRAQQAAGLRPTYFARSLVGSSQLHQELGAAAAGIVISQLVPSPFKPTLPVARSYLKLLAQRDAKALPTFVELEGFINARLMVSVLRRIDGSASKESLVKALSSVGRTEIGGFAIDFEGRNRNGSQFVELTMLRRDGTFAQ